MNRLVMSGEYHKFCDELRKYGYDIIPTKKIDIFHKPEQHHADMQILKIRDRIFTLGDCADKIGKTYPENVRLNCLFLNNTLYGKLSATDKTVLDFCEENGIKTVDVSQGYTRCSTLIIAEKAAITADKSIEKALRKNEIDVLLISQGNIRLEGFDYGFIGGASFSGGNTVYFFGNIRKHPDYEKISEFCKKYNSNIEILCPAEPLTDIGGAVEIE